MPVTPDPDRLRELRAQYGTHMGCNIAKQDARKQAIADLRAGIDWLRPGNPDFDADLRGVLRRIADLLEN